jgi:hypothetical protein
MTTISSDFATVTPHLVLGYSARQRVRSIKHFVVGRPDPDVTLRPAATRQGTLRLLFLAASDADAAREAFALPGVWTLADSDVSEIEMSFVVDPESELQIVLDPSTRLRWTLDVTFCEVLS